MKSQKLENDLLLRESGELPVRRQKRLATAIAMHPELQHREQTLKALQTLWKETVAETPLPGADCLRNIHCDAAALALRQQRKSTGVRLFTPLRLAAVTAAAATVILTAGLFLSVFPLNHTGHARLSRTATELDSRIADALDEIDSSLLTLLDTLAESGSPPEEESDALALKLMFMEDS